MDKEKIKQFIISQREDGIPDEQIFSFLQKKGVIKTPEPEKNFTGSESATFQSTGEEGLLSGTAKAIGNVPSSAINLAKNVTGAILHPVETVKSVVDITKGLGAKAGEKFLEGTDIGQSILQKANESRVARGLPELQKDATGKIQVDETPELKMVNTIGKFISDRYGNLDKFKETVIEDPVGVLADISTDVSGGGTLITKAGTLSKVGEVAKVGEVITQASKALEPVNAISKTVSKTSNIIKQSVPGQVIKEIVPTVKDIRANEVVKALDLTQGDISNITKKTGNDVTSFIVDNNLIKKTPEETANALNNLRKSARENRGLEISKVKNKYTYDDIPRLKDGLNTIFSGIKEVVGLEDEVAKVKSLLKKKSLTLNDVQTGKDLLDANSNIYSKIGDVKSSATARGLDNVRKNIKTFIEKEVKDNTGADIKKINNDIQTSYAIEDAINTRLERNLTRKKISLSDIGLGIGGSIAFNPAVGLGIYVGKKLIETPAFRLAFTKLLSKQPVNKVKTLVTEIKNNTVSKETQAYIKQLADEAKNNLSVIESASNVLEPSKSEQ